MPDRQVHRKAAHHSCTTLSCQRPLCTILCTIAPKHAQTCQRRPARTFLTCSKETGQRRTNALQNLHSWVRIPPAPPNFSFQISELRLLSLFQNPSLGKIREQYSCRIANPAKPWIRGLQFPERTLRARTRKERRFGRDDSAASTPEHQSEGRLRARQEHGRSPSDAPT